jgi:6,7-dimethyl-8-ribityllumazine synthase
MTGPKTHVMIVEARFYGDLADEMAAGAVAALEQAGASHERVAVPGTFEIPAAIGLAAKSGQFDGYVALGCVIRGQTTHYDYVCQESARALQDLATGGGLAIGYGILTCENRDQAWVRADRGQGDKGRAAAEACLAMVALRRRFVTP